MRFHKFRMPVLENNNKNNKKKKYQIYSKRTIFTIAAVRRCSAKQVLKILQKFTGKYMCQSLFSSRMRFHYR